MDDMNSTPVQNEQPSAAPKTCPHCGKPLADNALFCGNCGTRLNGEPAPAPAPAPAAPTAPVEDTRPLKTTDYLLMILLMCVPVVSFIIFMIWAFSGGTNVNRRNFARAYLLYHLIAFALGILLGIVLGIFAISMGTTLMEELMYYSAILPTFLL